MRLDAKCALLAVVPLLLVALLATGCPKAGPPTTEPAKVGGVTEPSTKQPSAAKKLKVVISTRPGQWNLDERVRGYKETIEKDYPEIEIVQVIDDETKYEVGQKQSSAMLAKFPDLAGFAGVNAASGPGIAAAVKAAGQSGKIVVVAMDGDTPILNLIKEGTINASVAQRQYFMTYIGVKYLYGLKHGQFRKPGDTSNPDLPEIPKKIDTGTVEVNKDNVEAFYTPSQGAKEQLASDHPDWLNLLADRKRGEAEPNELYICIGISTGVEYWNATKTGLEDVASELGVKSKFEGPLEHRPDEQANILDQAIARKPAGILIAPGNPETLKPYINKAIDAGLNVICFDTDAPDSRRLAYYGTSNYEAGVMGAHILARELRIKHEQTPAAK